MGSLLTICYLLASVTFILGLKMLSNPATARRGNLIAAGGMTLAIIGTIFLYDEGGEPLHNHGWILAGIVIGGIAGTITARKVQMTAMPEMVSLFNGMGGACAALISIVEFGRLHAGPSLSGGFTMYPPLSALGDDSAPKLHLQFGVPTGELLIILLCVIIGSISFAGSVIAWAKLNGRIKDIAFKGQHVTNLGLLAVILALAGYVLAVASRMPEVDTGHVWKSMLEVMNAPLTPLVRGLFYVVFVLSVVYGVFFV